MRSLFAAVCAALLVSTAGAADLSTIDTETGRYLPVLGKSDGATIVKDAIPPSGITGVHDIASAGGNAGLGWEMTDGDRLPPNAANTFADPNAVQFQGLKFKKSATVTSLDWANFVYLDGGTFDATPTIEVYDRGTDVWTPVAVTWSTPYDGSLGAPGVREYTITLDAPATNVDGVRFIGDANGSFAIPGSPEGWIATAELTVNGSVSWGVDLSTDLTGLPGTTPIMTHSQLDINSLIDDDLTTFTTTVFAEDNLGVPQAVDYAGVLFDESQDQVAGFGITFKRFFDGGVFDTFAIETYDADSDAWTAVTGLDTASYFDDLTYVTDTAPVGVELGYLFTFNSVNDVDGIRIIGDGWGAAFEGFIGVTEIEVFGVPEPTALALLLAGGLLLRRR